MTNIHPRVIPAVFAVMLSALPATNVVAALSTSASTRLYAGGYSGAPVQESGGPDSAESSLSVNFDDAEFSATARASASMGVLKTYASAKLSNYQYESYNTICAVQPAGYLSLCGAGGAPITIDPARASASFSDSFTIARRPGHGGFQATTGVFVKFLIRVDGETSLTRDDSDALSGPGAQGDLTLTLPSVNFFFSRGYRGDSFYVTGYAPVLFDTPMAFSVSTSASVYASDYLGRDVTLFDRTGATDRYNFEAIADFGSTITLEGINFYNDAAGLNEFTDFDLITESGFQYKTNSVPPVIPEPQTVALLLTGLGVVAAMRRRQAPRA